MITPRFVGEVSIAASVVPALWFAIGYWYTMNRRDPIARHVWAFVSVIAGVLMLALIRRLFGLDPDHGWFAWLNTGFFCLVPVVLWWRVIVWWRSTH